MRETLIIQRTNSILLSVVGQIDDISPSLQRFCQGTSYSPRYFTRKTASVDHLLKLLMRGFPKSTSKLFSKTWSDKKPLHLQEAKNLEQYRDAPDLKKKKEKRNRGNQKNRHFP